MGFYELGNGCDSCDTVSSSIPNNVNMQMDSNSGVVANMAYGTQANTVQQYNNTISSSGYPQQGNNIGNMGNMGNIGNMGNMGNSSTSSTMGAYQQPTQPKQVVKQVITTTTTAQALSTPTKVNHTNHANNAIYSNHSNNANNANHDHHIEGFNNMNDTIMSNDKKWIVFGLVIFTALASNECCKYFLNKSLQLNDGSPMYYIAYVGVAVLLTMAAIKYSSTT